MDGLFDDSMDAVALHLCSQQSKSEVMFADLSIKF